MAFGRIVGFKDSVAKDVNKGIFTVFFWQPMEMIEPLDRNPLVLCSVASLDKSENYSNKYA